MNLSIRTLRNVGLVASVAVVLGLNARAATPSDAFPVFDSYIKLTGKAADVKGNGSSFARRYQFPENGSWGIEQLVVNKEVGEGANLNFEGKALVGAENYLGAVKYTKNEVGTFDLGYKRYRTFYDGIGGFFPLNNRWNQLANPELHADRAKFWVEAKIERPNAPKFEFRYTNELRSGKKDSTIWGDTDFTGVPSYYGVGASALNPYSSNRKLIPAFIRLNERQQNYVASVSHNVGNTNVEFEIVRNLAKSNDTRSVNRYPGELQLFPRQSSSTNPPQVYPPETISNEVRGYDRQYFDSTIMAYTLKFETKFTDQVSVFGGLLYSDGSADIGGDRQMLQLIPTLVGTSYTIGGHVGTSGRPPYSYTTLAGNTNETIKALNAGVKFHPTSDLFASIAMKYEKAAVDGSNLVRYTSNRVDQTTGVVTPIIVDTPNVADRSEKTWLPEAEFRYTGIKDVALYGTFEYRRSPGDEYGSSTGVGTGGIAGSPVVSYDNVKLKHALWKTGANWTVNSMVSLRGEIFYKDHTNGFYGYNTSAGDSFVLGYQMLGTKLTAIVKPVANLSFNTRFVRQSGKMDLTIDNGTGWQSNDTKNYQIGETVDWAPTPQTFVQANVNVAYNTIKTAYPIVGGLANDVIRNADNNYRNGSLVAGFVADRDTDVSFQYTFYRADNYKTPTNATLWYGAGVKEYTVAAAVKHRFNDQLVGTFKLGYFNSENQTTGGNTNFKGPMAYISFDHAL